MAQTTNCFSLEIKIFAPPKSFVLARRYCCVSLVDPSFSELKSKILLKLCTKIQLQSKTTQCALKGVSLIPRR